jgi:hypothetical protein
VKFLERTLARLDLRRPVVLAELHPELRRRVLLLLDHLGGRFTPYCGYRDEAAQKRAKATGHSNASWGQSPHNFKPALAVDVVLDPRHVDVRPNPADENYPDLWDDASPEAVQAWEDLEEAAERYGLERVNLRGVRDKPHLQLHDWRRRIPQ